MVARRNQVAFVIFWTEFGEFFQSIHFWNDFYYTKFHLLQNDR